MTAACGAGILVQMKNSGGTYQTVSGLRTRNITFNAEPVDTTNADSVGRWRTLLDACGVRSASVSGDGVFDDSAGEEVVRDAFFNNQLRDFKFTVPSFGAFEGSFKVTQMAFAGEYNGEITYSQAFESAGVITFSSL